jgi:hypothetical protein
MFPDPYAVQVAADNSVFGQTGPKVGSFDAGYGSTQMVRLVGESGGGGDTSNRDACSCPCLFLPVRHTCLILHFLFSALFPSPPLSHPPSLPLFSSLSPSLPPPSPSRSTPSVLPYSGQKKAREMWFLARMYNAQQALEMGLVNVVVPLEKLEEETLVWWVKKRRQYCMGQCLICSF